VRKLDRKANIEKAEPLTAVTQDARFTGIAVSH